MSKSDKERFKDCIVLSDDESEIEEIIIDCLEVNDFNDIFYRLQELYEFEKECNVCCTLKRIKITGPQKEYVPIKVNNPNGLNQTEIAGIIKSNIQHLQCKQYN